jgi:hypothetical protein
MNPDFIRLHYPCYWRYDVLFGLKVMAEAGFLKDSRCDPALDFLQSKELPTSHWRAEGRFYQTGKPKRSRLVGRIELPSKERMADSGRDVRSSRCWKA